MISSNHIYEYGGEHIVWSLAHKQKLVGSGVGPSNIALL